MDVNKSDFTHLLPAILKHIASSHFVAFDLELSGIPTHKIRNASSRQTVQERYSELKLAAEKYHILQFGITCVDQDSKNQTYQLRSYNFNLSPLINDDLGLDRDFTYSASAVDFLLGHGYEMDKPFRYGIPYLSRVETTVAEHSARARMDRTAIPDIKLAADDHKSHRFVKHANDQISAWQKSGSASLSCTDVPLFIGGLSSSGQAQVQPKPPLNAFERRLVHQLVRAEFPTLSTQSRGDYVQVLIKDEKEVSAYKESVQRRLNDLLSHQIGFRWVTEALVAGDLTGLLPAILGPQKRGSTHSNQRNASAFERAFNETMTSLKNRRKVLVGHNCFIDLIYFYSTFIGELPDTVSEFRDAISSIFPLIIDTKYLATAGADGHPFRIAPLSQIDEALSDLKSPAIEPPRDHPAHFNAEQYHEAGYDSYVTAKVLLRLVVKYQLNNNQPGPPVINDRIPLHHEVPDEASQKFSTDKLSKRHSDPTRDIESKPKVTNRASKPLLTPASPLASKKLSSTSNRFASLLDDSKQQTSSSSSSSSSSSDEDEDVAVQQLSPKIDTKAQPLKRSKSDQPEVPSRSAKASDLNKILIPPWEDDFWATYGNKLRVYGTVEELCDLAEEEEDGETDDKDSSGSYHSIYSSLTNRLRNMFL